MKKRFSVALMTGLWCICMAGGAGATSFTMTSPTSAGLLPSGVTEVGGIVFDLVGTNGIRIVSQLAASSLFVGMNTTNPLVIGTQTGFDASTVSALGGGISEAAIRITLWDGDSASGDFDWQENTLLLNGYDFGNMSDVQTDTTSNDGMSSSGLASGFANGQLSTGFFYSTSSSLLGNLYASIVADGQVVFAINDVDPGDNFFDFTRGLDGSLVNVGTGPTVTPTGGNNAPVPEPGTMLLLATGLAGLTGGLRRKRRT